jgi:hypothetical protein
MSADVMASTDPTPTSSGEQWSRTMDLVDEIKRKLAQVNGICCAVRCARETHADHTTIHGSLWAATDLIEDVEGAFDELWKTVIKGTHKS